MQSFTRTREGYRLLAVHDAVVVAEREIHHRTDDDLAIHGDGTVLGFVHAEDAALRRVQDRRAHEGAVNAAVGDREDATLQVLEADFALAGLHGIVGEIFFDFGEGFLVRIADDRNDEALFGADGPRRYRNSSR